jgi:hypothetical protein
MRPGLVEELVTSSFSILKHLTMRPDPRQPERVFIRLAVNQDNIRFHMAITEAFVGAGQGMVAVFMGSGLSMVSSSKTASSNASRLL